MSLSVTLSDFEWPWKAAGEGQYFRLLKNTRFNFKYLWVHSYSIGRCRGRRRLALWVDLPLCDLSITTLDDVVVSPAGLFPRGTCPLTLPYDYKNALHCRPIAMFGYRTRVREFSLIVHASDLGEKATVALYHKTTFTNAYNKPTLRRTSILVSSSFQMLGATRPHPAGIDAHGDQQLRRYHNMVYCPRRTKSPLFAWSRTKL